MKTKDRFDLEQEIMGTWNIIDELKCLADGWDNLTEDNKLNIIIGLIDLYHLKFNTMFDTFEQCISKKEFKGLEDRLASYETSLNQEHAEDIFDKYRPAGESGENC